MAGPHDDGDWDPSTSAHRRMLRIHANDGLIAAAGVIQGLNSAGATGAEAMVAALATMIVGGLLVFGAEFGEAAAERDSQLAIVEAERLRLEMSPQEEFAELVAIYRRKGLTERVAHDVARELSEKDALAAQLDAEYGIAELGRPRPAAARRPLVRGGVRGRLGHSAAVPDDRPRAHPGNRAGRHRRGGADRQRRHRSKVGPDQRICGPWPGPWASDLAPWPSRCSPAPWSASDPSRSLARLARR